MKIESDKFVIPLITFVHSGLFKAKAVVVESTYLSPQVMNKIDSSVYLLEYSLLWHSRLGHFNHALLRKW